MDGERRAAKWSATAWRDRTGERRETGVAVPRLEANRGRVRHEAVADTVVHGPRANDVRLRRFHVDREDRFDGDARLRRARTSRGAAGAEQQDQKSNQNAHRSSMGPCAPNFCME
jgi:hypothetical protein